MIKMDIVLLLEIIHLKTSLMSSSTQCQLVSYLEIHLICLIRLNNFLKRNIFNFSMKVFSISIRLSCILSVISQHKYLQQLFTSIKIIVYFIWVWTVHSKELYITRFPYLEYMTHSVLVWHKTMYVTLTHC